MAQEKEVVNNLVSNNEWQAITIGRLIQELLIKESEVLDLKGELYKLSAINYTSHKALEKRENILHEASDEVDRVREEVSKPDEKIEFLKKGDAIKKQANIIELLDISKETLELAMTQLKLEAQKKTELTHQLEQERDREPANLLQRLQLLESERDEAIDQRDTLQNEFANAEKNIEILKNQADAYKKAMDNVCGEQDMLKKNLLQAEDEIKSKSNLFELQNQAKQKMEAEIHNLKVESQKQTELILQIKEERDRCNAKVLGLTSTITDTQNVVHSLQSKLMYSKEHKVKTENQLKEEQKMSEAVRKNLTLLTIKFEEAQAVLEKTRMEKETLQTNFRQLTTNYENRLSTIAKMSEENEIKIIDLKKKESEIVILKKAATQLSKKNEDLRLRQQMLKIQKDNLMSCFHVDIKSENGNTPLHSACQKGHLETVKYLISKGADINIQNEFGNTPLNHACEFGYLETVNYLIRKGADINLENENGNTPLHCVCWNGDLETVKHLISKGDDINIQDKYGDTLLHYACWNGHLETVNYLISEGADINIPGENGFTPLHCACQNGNLKMVKYLISKGDDINFQDIYGDTLLHYACWNGHLETVNYLISKGADIDIPGENGFTPLHFACQNDNLETVMYLMSKGAYINIKDEYGNTPLHYAWENGHLEIIELLKCNGAKQ